MTALQIDPSHSGKMVPSGKSYRIYSSFTVLNNWKSHYNCLKKA